MVKTVYLNEKRRVQDYLYNHTVTASMLSELTGIKQKNICRYKRDLEKKQLLWEVRKGKCKITGCQAWYLTTNPFKVENPEEIQLRLCF
jgi:hypothetical protein